MMSVKMVVCTVLDISLTYISYKYIVDIQTVSGWD